MAAPPQEFGDLLLDVGLPDVGLLDDLQLDCGLSGLELPPGLDDLGLEFCCAGTAATTGDGPASSDLLESLQLEASAFCHPASSTGARPSSGSGSGTESPVLALPVVTPGVPAAAGAGPAGGGRASCDPDGDSPSTSESEAAGRSAPARGRSGSPATSGSQRGGSGGSAATAAAAPPARGGAQQPRYATEEEKRLARMQRNRENAQLSRQRKKQHMTDLELRCSALQAHNVQLAGAVQRLTAENAALRQQLALICQQAGRNVPAGPAAGAKPAAAAAAAAAGATKPAATAAAAAKSAAAPAQPAARPAAPPAAPPAAKPAGSGAAATQPATPAAAGTPAAAARPGLQWPLLPFSFLPKMALQQQQAAVAAAQQAAKAAQQTAKAAQPAAPRPAPAVPSPAPKRARTAAGASTAFLALFTLFMFAGPFAPAPLATLGSGHGAAGAHRGLQALPDAAAAAGGLDSGLHHGGRGLQALPMAASGGDHSLDSGGGQLPFGPQLPHHPPQALSPAEGGAGLQGGAGGGHLQQLLNSTLQALLLEPGNAALEAAALQRLQELGPVALLLDADGPGAGANPLAASVAFPQLADQLFGSAGLEVPQMCQQVLEFDAASVPHAARSRRSLERYVLGATGFRGRSLAAAGAGGVLAQPAAAAAAGGGRVQQAAAEPLRIEELPEGEEEELLGSGGAAGAGALLPAGGAAGGPPVLVSLLLPANASGGQAGTRLAAVDKVFVVLLHPQQRYVTYSCALPRPVVL